MIKEFKNGFRRKLRAILLEFERVYYRFEATCKSWQLLGEGKWRIETVMPTELVSKKAGSEIEVGKQLQEGRSSEKG